MTSNFHFYFLIFIPRDKRDEVNKLISGKDKIAQIKDIYLTKSPLSSALMERRGMVFITPRDKW